MLKELVRERLIAAADEIFSLFERTIASYEEQLCRAREENEKQRRQLEDVSNTKMLLHVQDVQLLIGHQEELPPSAARLEHDDRKQPHVKEEEEGPQLPHIKEEQDINLPLAVISEGDQEEAPDWSQLQHDHHGRPPPDIHLAPHFGHTEGSLRNDAVSDNKRLINAEKETTLNNQNTSQTRRKRRTAIKRFSCSVCGKNFCYGYNLTLHIATHTGEHRFRCTVCGEGFIKKANMLSHMRKHTEGKPFSCPICAKKFPQKVHMDSHMRIHTGEKPFSCSICAKRFTQKVHMDLHMRVHTGEKPFSCSVCGQTFAQKQNMNTHMRIHTGEKPFSCSVCGNTFAQKVSLTAHKATHTGEKPFTCSICSKPFSYKHTLKAHMQTHKGGNPFTCSVWDQTVSKSFESNEKI
ncbi:gastrula zinc finger protein XlCGF57.1-like [Phyllopteryx taeniolatus]|uniref:gastrula zinc finger protein XlCGF57.1-like n=1 Tax=Phyllopteryx taeniolatus TaxID=161469 RepID=UPI002AD36BE4|nr:gastrula zinc finger protein XlCGF57.1-like [Phyllopteryx taeniolatus]